MKFVDVGARHPLCRLAHRMHIGVGHVVVPNYYWAVPPVDCISHISLLPHENPNPMLLSWNHRYAEYNGQLKETLGIEKETFFGFPPRDSCPQ